MSWQTAVFISEARAEMLELGRLSRMSLTRRFMSMQAKKQGKGVIALQRIDLCTIIIVGEVYGCCLVDIA